MNFYQSPRQRLLTRAFGILLVAALLIGLAPARATAAATVANCTPSYEVRRGDSLTKIGDRFGFAPNQIAYINNWKEPFTIYVGQKICIPSSSVSGLAKLESKYANAPAAYFTAGRNGTVVLVYTYTYPKTSVIVKAGTTSGSAKSLVNIGTISNVSNGKSYKFNLPASLQNVKNLKICLKDRSSSYLQCAVPRTGP